MLNREEIEKYLELCKQSIVEARKYLALKIMKITIILLAVVLLCLTICAILQFFASIGK